MKFNFLNDVKLHSEFLTVKTSKQMKHCITCSGTYILFTKRTSYCRCKINVLN